MADELDLDLEFSTEEQVKENKVEKRIKDLSEKVRLTATERDELAKAKDESEAKAASALKDVDFYKNFSTTSSKYPGSAEYQEQIRERVNKGYDLEEATVAVLAKEGKYTPPPAPQAPRTSPTGGSAPTTLKSQNVDKPISEMNLDDMRAQLVEAEKRGDIGLN